MKQVISLAISITGDTNAMGKDSNYTRCNRNCTHTGRQQIKQIVDDSHYYPPLLRWLKRNLKLFRPVNNANYNPTLPTAA